MGCIRPAGRS